MRNKLKNDTHFEKYERILNENRKETTTCTAIRSKNHQLYSISQTTIALTSFCNKRYWTDALHSVHCGHFSISNWFIIIQILMIKAFFELLLPMHLLLLECLLKFDLSLIIIPQYLHSTGCFPFFGNMFWNSRGHWVYCHTFRHLELSKMWWVLLLKRCLNLMTKSAPAPVLTSCSSSQIGHHPSVASDHF